MFRVLITDANYKNAVALTRHAKRDITDLFAIGHTTSHGWLAKLNGCFDSVVSGVSLDSALHGQAYDMVIPVGGLSVLTVAAQSAGNAVLPPCEELQVSYDKLRTVELAHSLGVPAPITWLVSQPGQSAEIPIRLPCVVKPAREATGLKLVSYCRSSEELSNAVAHQLHCLQEKAAVLVQEFIEGKGFGLFALMDHGVPLRVFMHQRIRDNPPSGGASTAARAYYSERLKELGLRLLSALQWHGVAMVEFKYSDAIEDFVLMEINGKFWGSLELALSAGINFGADLIRLYRGEKLSYSEEYDRDSRVLLAAR